MVSCVAHGTAHDHGQSRQARRGGYHRAIHRRSVDAHAPVATLQMMATRFKPLMKVMERANNITGQAAHAEVQAKLQ